MLKELFCVMRAVFRQQIIMMRRYMFNTMSSMVTLYIVFMLLFFGVRAVGGAAVTTATLEGMVVGYALWMLSIMGYSDLAWGLIQEAQMGTLEKLYLSPLGFRWICGFRQLTGLIITLVMVTVLVGIIMLTTGVYLRLDLVSVLPLLLLGVLPAYGFGFMSAGLALIYKRIQSAFQILQFVFVGFMVAPASWPISAYLPLNMGNRLLNQVMVQGRRLWELDPSDIGTLVLVAAAYCGLGLALFGRMETVARDRGLLGHY